MERGSGLPRRNSQRCGDYRAAQPREARPNLRLHAAARQCGRHLQAGAGQVETELQEAKTWTRSAIARRVEGTGFGCLNFLPKPRSTETQFRVAGFPPWTSWWLVVGWAWWLSASQSQHPHSLLSLFMEERFWLSSTSIWWCLRGGRTNIGYR